MARALALAAVCFALWLLLSGHYTPMLLGLGVLSCALVAWVAHALGMLDHGELTALRPLALPGYVAWLLKEIVKANIDVTRRILGRDLPISPTLVRVPLSQRTDAGRVMFANSITLTPGTVTTRVHEDALEVHALSREGADDLLAGEMDRRVTALEKN